MLHRLIDKSFNTGKWTKREWENNLPEDDITELNSSCLLNYDDIPKTRSLSAIMLEKGFRQIKGRCVRYPGDRRKHYVWVKNGVTDKWAIEQLTTKDPVRARERSF